MNRNFLLYVGSVMCLSLGATQISNAMQSGSDGPKKVELSIPTLQKDRISVSFDDPRSNKDEWVSVFVKFKIQNPRNGKTQYCLLSDVFSMEKVNLKTLTEDSYNQTDALLAEAIFE